MSKILIVEDNPSNLKLTTLLLTKAGYTPLSALNATDGIQLAKQENPALILMDIQLPGMDGLTAAKLLKNDPETAKIKIIALTAFAMRGDEEKIREAGCDDYLAKPFRYEQLYEIVRRHNVA